MFELNNFDSIKNNSYKWSEEEISSLYKLIDKVLKKCNITDEFDKEDIRQIAASRFFSEVLKNIKICDKGIMIGYICKCISNEAARYLKEKNKSTFDIYDINEDGKFTIEEDILSDELYGDEKYFNQSINEYKAFLKEIVNGFPFLKGYYFENKKQRELGEEHGMTKANASVRLSKERETLKIALIQNGYTSDFFESCCGIQIPFKMTKVDDKYKKMETLINKYGLTQLIHYYDFSVEQVAEALKMEQSSIRYALKYFDSKNLNNKRKK